MLKIILKTTIEDWMTEYYWKSYSFSNIFERFIYFCEAYQRYGPCTTEDKWPTAAGALNSSIGGEHNDA